MPLYNAKEVQEDIWAGKPVRPWKALPPQLRCTRCVGSGLQRKSRVNGAKCKSCMGYKIPAIPICEVSNEQSR